MTRFTKFILFSLFLALITALPPFYDVLLNNTIVFLGDSITRYQYIALVLSIHLPRANMTDHLVTSRSWSDWNTYFKATNNLLSPYEVCDCYIPDGSSVSRHLGYENRYYRGPNNVSVSYIQWLGDKFTMSGHHPTAGTSWSYSDITDILIHVVAPLSPRAIVINAGHWPVSPNTVSRALSVAKNVVGDGVVIWKSVTPLFNRSYPMYFTLNETAVPLNIGAVEDAAARAGVCIFNTTAVTSALHSTRQHLYVDRRHFRIRAYEAFNDQLMHLLAKGRDC